MTLVGQGLTLPAVIRALGLAHAGKREHRADRAEEVSAREGAIESAIARLDRLAVERKLPEDVVHTLRAQLRDRLKHFEHGHERADGRPEHSKLYDEIEFLLIAAERERVNELYRQGGLKDEARRRIERELDLREASVANHEHEE